MQQIIKMPVRTHEDFGDSLAKLIAVVDRISSTKADEIVLDFSDARMLNPFFLGGLVCTISRYELLGKRFQLNHDANLHINSYLKTISFTQGYSATEDTIPEFVQGLKKYRTKTYIPVISFRTGLTADITRIRECILDSITDIIKNQLNFSAREIMPLSYFLDELTNNINDHSQALSGFVFAQYYPGSNYLDICICDAGKGIFQSFKDNPGFNPNNEAEAIRLAISGKSTKKRSEARGFGISTSINMLINGLRGKLFLWSGSAAFTGTIENQAISSVKGSGYFQGTFIAIRLPTIIPENFNFYKYTEN